MPGLDPGIHQRKIRIAGVIALSPKMDCRVKPGNDG
jgi:hypothetical protein